MQKLTTQCLKAVPSNIETAAGFLLAGEVIALPTETVYGLAMRADGPEGLEAIYKLKARDRGKPLPICVTGLKMAALYAEVSPLAQKLMKHFWPGPLTIVLPKLDAFSLPAACYALDGTIALRCPDTDWARYFRKKKIGIPLALTSANPSGDEAANLAEQVREYFDGQVPLILDGGEVGGQPSTIIRMWNNNFEVLRPGPISADNLAAVVKGRMRA